MPDSTSSHDDAAQTQEATAAERQARYPRPWWLAVIRFLLLIAGATFVVLYLHALFAVVFHQPLQTSDRSLLNVTTILAAAVLTAGGVWAIRDTAREWIAQNQQQQAVQRVPFAVAAERRWRTDLAQARAESDRPAEGVALGNIGFWLTRQERYVEAEPYLTQALELTRAMGDRFHEERYLGYLAGCAAARGDMDEAEALHRESLAVARTLTRERLPFPHPEEADVLEEVADTYAVVGHFLVEERNQRQEGIRLLAEAEARYREEARAHALAAQERGPQPWPILRPTRRVGRKDAHTHLRTGGTADMQRLMLPDLQAHHR
jgi:Tfp pilus assembly protein PilF